MRRDTISDYMAMTEANDIAGSTQQACLRHLVEQGRISLGVNLALALIIAFSLRGITSPGLLLAWLSGLGAVTLGRAVALHDGRVAIERANGIDRALRQITIATFATAALWGATPWVFLTDASPYESLVLLIAVAGLSAGAIPVLACIWSVYLGYVTLIIVPVAAWLFLQIESVSIGPGLLTVVFLAALAAAGRNYANNFRQAHTLAAELARLSAETEAANRDLRGKIEEAVEAREALVHSEHRFHTAFDQAPIGMALTRPDGTIFQANPALQELLDLEDPVRKSTRLSELVLAEDVPGFEALLDRIVTGAEPRSQTDVRLLRADSQVLWTSIAIALVEDAPEQERYLIVEVQDITESVELSARLQYEASHDALTDLTNRREFERRLQRLLGGHRHADRTHTLCYLDLDRFKVINDSRGHLAGDEVLRQVSGVLHQHVRAGDTIARVGGDEFALLLDNCDAPHALRIAEDLIRAIGEFRFLWQNQVFRLDLSIGIAEVLPDAGAVSEIMRNADTACATAKEAGGARAHVYRADDHEMQRRHGEIEWVSRITRALEHGGFELYAQPILDIRQNSARRGLHFEILVRMRGEDGQLMLPSAFLPPAERYGLATRLDRWVVSAVFDWFRAHPALVKRVDACAINLSGTSLDDPDFTEQLVSDMRAAPLAPAQLRFEVTETAAIGHLTQASRFMARIESLGCRFALDDFGSGLSSFGYLRTLPVDTLKIDGQFVRDIARDPVDHALVRSINDIGRVLGLATVAEYVEDRDTLNALRAIGVDFVQGHFLGVPVPLDALFDQPAVIDDTV